MPPPVTAEEVLGQGEESPSKKIGKFLFERVLEKRMFFGNYKPRYLTIEKVGGRLMMAYRYIPSKKVKNEFELTFDMEDFLEELAVTTEEIDFNTFCQLFDTQDDAKSIKSSISKQTFLSVSLTFSLISGFFWEKSEEK